MGAHDDDARNPFGHAEATRKLTLARRGRDNAIVFPTVRVVAGRDMLRFVTLHGQDEVVIGRDESGGLVLSDASVSRRHARITSDGQGVIALQDLGSTNGTAVNGQPIDVATLRPGDHIEIGTVSLRLDMLSTFEIAHLESVLDRIEAKNRDPLTGLLTRAWIDEELPAVRADVDARGLGASCLFVDIDKFKGINDRFGHQAGDEVLVGVARLLLVGVRETDACVRYGGEEVVLFLPGSDEANAFEVAERIRGAIEAHDWSRTAPGASVTASFGVATLRSGESLKEWIGRADRALYAAKVGGRNRVVRASEL
jgi:diguanylate cyclase (GGDEF)-like protein